MPSSSSSTHPLAVGHGLDPSLPLQDLDGRPLKSGDLLSGRALVLYFLRAASCAVCLRHARGIVRDSVLPDGSRPDLAFVVPGGPAQAARAHRALGTAATATGSLRVLSSSGAAAYARAGLERSWMLQSSGTYLIDREGTVRYARSATLPTGGYDAEELALALRSVEA